MFILWTWERGWGGRRWSRRRFFWHQPCYWQTSFPRPGQFELLANVAGTKWIVRPRRRSVSNCCYAIIVLYLLIKTRRNLVTMQLCKSSNEYKCFFLLYIWFLFYSTMEYEDITTEQNVFFRWSSFTKGQRECVIKNSLAPWYYGEKEEGNMLR